jgi:hypothetical protein
MSFESEVSSVALSAFSEPATLNSTAVSVLIDRSVEVVDADGNVRQMAALVHAIKGSLPAWEANDLLTSASGNVRLLQVISDDGYVVQIEARPVA